MSRALLAVVVTVAGTALFLFSIAIAFGWDRGPLSAIGAALAFLGLVFVFWGYWAIRKSTWAPVVAAILTTALGLGSTFVVVGLLFLFFNRAHSPTGYFLLVGCLCLPAFYRFRAHLKAA